MKMSLMRIKKWNSLAWPHFLYMPIAELFDVVVVASFFNSNIIIGQWSSIPSMQYHLSHEHIHGSKMINRKNNEYHCVLARSPCGCFLLFSCFLHLCSESTLAVCIWDVTSLTSLLWPLNQFSLGSLCSFTIHPLQHGRLHSILLIITF